MSVEDFLSHAGWSGAASTLLAGDASARRYTRLRKDGGTAILMEDPGGDVATFARLSEYLSGIGLSAPGILTMDAAAGFLLLDDFGDDLFGGLADRDPTQEASLYMLATDVLIHLHRHRPPDVPLADPVHLADITGLAFDAYAPGAGGPPDQDASPACRDAFETALSRHAPETNVMILRDYHALNLLFLPDRPGVRQAGLLDFQDARAGHRAYDLVSLLRDARRDVPDAVEEDCIRHYLTATGEDEAAFRTAYVLLGAQRNLRILGVFANLAKQRGKPAYIDLIPRVWGHLTRDFDNPVMADIAPILRDALPAPESDVLERLKSPCPTH